MVQKTIAATATVNCIFV